MCVGFSVVSDTRDTYRRFETVYCVLILEYGNVRDHRFKEGTFL